MKTVGARGPKPKPESEVRGKLLPIRVTEDEEVLLKSGAKEDGDQPVGTWLRELGLKRARRLLKK